MDLNWRCPNSC